MKFRILILTIAAVAVWTTAPSTKAAEPLPTRLTDAQFWALATDASEPSGTFHSENLVSNEIKFQGILPRLTQLAVPGRAYVGVGSEQNFTYIAGVRPSIALIVDIRRGNLDLHLVYKALFEMSADRVEFVSRLFSRARPAGLTSASSAREIFAAFESAAPSETLYRRNIDAITALLVTTHKFGLSDGDREGLRYVYRSWFDGGPSLQYALTTGPGSGGATPATGRTGGGRGGRGGFGGAGGGMPTYAELMTTDDGTGKSWSYLASEERYQFMKDLEARNMLVPIVGNFGGPKALRAAGAYLKQHNQIVSAFYASNVEQYLRQDNIWDDFCRNAATLPADAKSVMVRSERGGSGTFELAVVPLVTQFTACAAK